MRIPVKNLCGKASPSRGHGPRPGEIWLARVPFSGSGSKVRPVLIRKSSTRGIVCSPCTTKDRPEHYAIIGLLQAGLDSRTYIKYEEVTIPESDFRYRTGMLSAPDMKAYAQGAV